MWPKVTVYLKEGSNRSVRDTKFTYENQSNSVLWVQEVPGL